MKLNVPEKRAAICYARVKPTNMNWLKRRAKEAGMGVSPLLDSFLDELRFRYPIPKKNKKAS